MSPTFQKTDEKYNLLDVFLMLSLSAEINGTNAGVRTTAYYIIGKCNEEARQMVTDTILFSQEPLKEVRRIMENYTPNPYNVEMFNALFESGEMRRDIFSAAG